MFQAKEKSLIIVHNTDTKQCAEYLLGLISELPSSGIPINAIVVEAKKFSSYPAEQKSAKQNILYIGSFPESNLAEKNIHQWKFDQNCIRYGWHGNKGVMTFKTISEHSFRELAKFAEKDMERYNLDMQANVGKRGIKPLQRFNELPLIGKIAIGIGALITPFVVAGVGLAAAMGVMIKEKDNLDPKQMKENQQKFAVLHFSLNYLTDFLDINDDNNNEE